MILNRCNSSLVVIAGLFGAGMFLSALTLTSLEAATMDVGQNPPQPIHPACIEAFDPPEKVVVTYGECQNLAEGKPVIHAEDPFGVYYDRPLEEGDEGGNGYFHYKLVGELFNGMSLLHVIENSGGSGVSHQILTVDGMTDDFTWGDHLRLHGKDPFGDRCNRGIHSARQTSPDTWELTEQLAPFEFLDIEDRRDWRKERFFNVMLEIDGDEKIEEVRNRFELRPYQDIQNCANCCFAQAIRTVDYFAEPYKGEGKLVAVEISGEMIRRLPTKAFDGSSLPYQQCLKRVLKKASALQDHPETLRLTYPQYNQLMSDFDHLCVIQDGEFDGTNSLTLLVEEFEETLYARIAYYEDTGEGMDSSEDFEQEYRDGLEQVEIDIVRSFINQQLGGDQGGVGYHGVGDGPMTLGPSQIQGQFVVLAQNEIRSYKTLVSIMFLKTPNTILSLLVDHTFNKVTDVWGHYLPQEGHQNLVAYLDKYLQDDSWAR